MDEMSWDDVDRFEMEFALDELANYLDLLETEYENARGARQKDIESKFKEHDFEVQVFMDRYYRDFPSKIRYSFIILCFIEFEDQLNSALVKREMQSSKNRLLDRAKKFLDSKGAMDSKEWQFLTDFQQVRDCIVHTKGYIDASRDKNNLSVLCRRKGYGITNMGGVLEVEKEYCQKVMDTIKSFLSKIYDAR